MAPAKPNSAQRIASIWPGITRPTPAELRTAAYDSMNDSPFRGSKLLVCGGPRTSSKRLARLLLSAGIGVPMEYFNPNSFQTLISRWNIDKAGYLSTLYQKRSLNGVFATNLHYQQIVSWPCPRDFVDLFENAAVIYLIRPDKVAQAASLATCLLTGNWGFTGESKRSFYFERRLRNAARKAIKYIEDEDKHWDGFFAERNIQPCQITNEQVNRDTPTAINEIAGYARLSFDSAGLERMLQLDSGPYQIDVELKASLCRIVREIKEK